MAKISGKGLLVVALTLSLATSLLVYQYLQGTVNRTVKEGVPVVTAKTDIPAKSQIKAEMLQTVIMPAEYVQAGAVQDAQTILGVTVREKILAGEPVTGRRLLLEGKASGFTGIIPRDKRAVTLAVSEVSGVAGFIKAGDYVDVVVTFDQAAVGDNASSLLLQNVLVLATNHDSEALGDEAGKNKQDGAGKATTITLAVTPQEAARLALSEDKGKVRLALRPYQPSEDSILMAVVTPKDIVGSHTSPEKSEAGDGADRNGAPAPAPAEGSKGDSIGKGIIMIRGTKTEMVPVY